MSGWNGHIKRICEIPAPLLKAVNERLRALVASDPMYWEAHDEVKPNKFGIFSQTTQHIALGFPATMLRHRGAPQRYAAWADWEDVVQPIISLVTSRYRYERVQVNRIMLAKLLAGREIPIHVDTDPSSRIPHKVHVPLVTTRKVELVEANRWYHLSRGYAYEVNNQIPHGGANRGTVDRVHLIFDFFERPTRRRGARGDRRQTIRRAI